METRAAGTRAVRAAVAADHEGRIHAAARDYAVSLKHFDVYLRVEPDAALAEAVRSKAEQYRARLARIREVLTHAHEPAKAGDDDAFSARNAEKSSSASSSSTRPAPEPSHTETDLLKASPRALPRQPLRAIQHAAPGRFVVTLARTSVAGEENGGDAFSSGLRFHPRNPAKREALTGVGSSADRSPIERAGVTDEEADAWVEEARETRGEGKGAHEEKELMTVNEKEKEAVSFHDAAEDAPRHSRNQTEERDEKENGVLAASVRSGDPEEHPIPPSTPPARPAVPLRARSLRRAYWDTEFPGLLAFTEEDHRDDDARDDEEKDDETKENEFLSSDSFFLESAVDDAVRAFNVWFDASLRVLGDSIAETGSSYAPKVERLFKRGVSAIDKEWRAQFPDDATYISELSKKEYPSEANAVMRAATPFVHARAEKGARAD